MNIIFILFYFYKMSRFKLKRFCLILFSITILYYLYALYATMNSASEEEDIERLINYQRNDPIRLFPEIEVNI